MSTEGYEPLAAQLSDHGLLSWLDLSAVDIERGRVVFELPFRREDVVAVRLLTEFV